MSLSPHHSAYRTVAQGSGSVSYTTPFYITGDAERSITLQYLSAEAAPQSLVQVDARVSGERPAKLSIMVRNTAGGAMTLTGALTELFFQGDTGKIRLAAQFQEPANPNWAVPYDVVVRAYWSDGTFNESPAVRTRVANLSRVGGAFGNGWSIAGVPRLYDQGDGVHIVQDGVGIWFARSCAPACSFTSPDGVFSTLRWDAAQQTYRLRDPDGTWVEFNSDGNPTNRLDAEGGKTRFLYDASKRLYGVVDPVGGQLTLAYDAAGKLDWIRDPGGRTSDVTINAAGNLVQVLDPSGVVALSASYNAQHRLTGWTNRAGNTWNVAYDIYGSLASITAPQVATTDAGLTRPVIRHGSLEKAVLPGSGLGSAGAPGPARQPSQIWISATDARGMLTRFRHDAFRSATQIRQPMGRITNIARDVHGRAVNTTSAEGETTIVTYDGWKVTQTEDRSTGQILKFQYKSVETGAGDTVQVLEYVLRADTAVGYFTYRADSPVTIPLLEYAETGAEVHRTEYRTDPNLPFLVKHHFGPGGDQQYFYTTDGRANVDSVVNNGTRRTVYTRDAFGRVTGTRLTEASVNQTLGRSYDVLNRVLSTTDVDGQTASYGYNATGQLTSMDAPGAPGWGWEYNALGWATKRIYPDGGADVLEYDRAGNVTRRTDRRGRVATMTYDSLGALASVTADGQTARYRKDPRGRFLVAANAESTDSIAFSRVGTTSSIHHVATRGATQYGVLSSINGNGLRTAVTSSGLPTALSQYYDVGFEYRPHYEGHAENGIWVNGQRTYNTAYQGSDPAYRYPTGDTIRYTMDEVRYSRAALNNSVGERVHLDTRWRADWKFPGRNAIGDTVSHYGFDDAGQLTSRTDYQMVQAWSCTTDPYDGEEYCYPTTDLQQLAQVGYAYDAAGNPADPGTVVAPGNRLTAYDGYTLEYDAAGNMVRKTRPGVLDQTLEWNTLGQLTRVTTNGAVVTFGYDADGRRVRKTSPAGTTTYLYDGHRIAAELDGAGNAVAKYYYFAGVDDPHSVERGGQLYYYLRDYNGNIVGLMNSAGSLVNRYRYGPFGATEVAQEAVVQPYRFSGREYDAETGLYYFRARYYDPALHRFVSPDPLGPVGGRNAYTFLANNPSYGRDPSGLKPCVLLVWHTNLQYARQYGVDATYFKECDREADWSSVQRMIAERFGQIFEHYSDPATEAEYEAQMLAAGAQMQIDQERGNAALSNDLSEKSCGWAIALAVGSGALDVMMVAPVVRGLGLLAKAGYSKIAAGWVIREASFTTERQIAENLVYHHIEREFLNDQAAALARRGVQTARQAGPAAAGRLGGSVIESEVNVGMQWQDFVIPGHYTVKLAGRAGAICGSQ